MDNKHLLASIHGADGMTQKPYRIQPNWIPFYQRGYEAFDVQVDANAKRLSPNAFRHRLRSYTGQTANTWKTGKPPVVLPPAPMPIGDVVHNTAKAAMITLLVLAMFMIASFRGNPEFVVPKKGKTETSSSLIEWSE